MQNQTLILIKKDSKPQITHPAPEISLGRAIIRQNPVRKVPKREVFSMVLTSVTRAYADLNTKAISANEHNYLVNELTDNIIVRYPAIRISEIPEAIARGIRGKYGEFYDLSVISFEKFIEQYLLSDERMRTVISAREELPAAKPAPDKAAWFTLAKSKTLMALGRKVNGQSFGTMATPVYDFLDRLQLLQFNSDEKYDLMANACRRLIGGLKYKAQICTPHQRSKLRNLMQAYTIALTGGPVTSKQKQEVVRISKRLALDAFFSQVIMDNLDLAKMMDEKREAFINSPIDKLV